MKEQINPELAGRFIAERYGPNAAESVALLGGGDWSRAFSFRLNDRDLVARFGRHQEDFLKDQKARVFARPGLPVPKLLEIGEAFDGFYAISERHFGMFLETLDERGWRKLLPALLCSLDTLREIPYEGKIDWSGVERDVPPTWRQWLLASLEDHPGERVGGWREALKKRPEIEQVFIAGERALRSRVEVCPEARHIVHRDLLNRNVLVAEDASRFEAVFDWGCSLAGDFLYEVAWFTFWSPWYPALESLDFRQVVREHYQNIGLTVEHFDERLSCYELQIGLEHIAYATFTKRENDQQEIARRTLQVLEAR